VLELKGMSVVPQLAHRMASWPMPFTVVLGMHRPASRTFSWRRKGRRLKYSPTMRSTPEPVAMEVTRISRILMATGVPRFRFFDIDRLGDFMSAPQLRR